MSELLRNQFRAISFSVLLAFVMLSPTASLNVKADDIPHENYSLVQSNMDVLISMLRSTIRYSEFALMAMYNESMPQVEENLTVVRGLLTPANRLLVQIQDVAESYANLSRLLPPFASLSSLMDSFSVMETSLLGARGTVVTASKLANLTGDELLAAIDAIVRVNSLIIHMNRTIDDMLVSADDILGLVVDNRQPFTDNQLIELIEKLRDLLYTIQYEVDIAVSEGIHWNATVPFSMLWLSASDYYLGESIVGGGYLYYNGSFAPNHEIAILMDGENLTSVLTSSNGRFAFSHPIPINESWLGYHDLQAMASTPWESIKSNVVRIRILLIPTTIAMSINSELLSYDEHLTASVILKEVHGLPIVNASCHFTLDINNVNFTTDGRGEYNITWTARDIGFGTHYLQAFYDGHLPYAPSASEQLSLTVNIPTSIDVRLFASRFPEGYDYRVIGNGTLLANGTTPLPNQAITVYVDGIVMENATTDAQGEFTFSIPTRSMLLGGHTLTAEFLHRDVMWRYSVDDVGFTIYGLRRSKYPFFPIIPGWHTGGMPESYTYLFIGPYAYYFWLLVLALAGVAVRLLQIGKRRKRLTEKASSGSLEFLDERIAASAPPPAASAEDLATELDRKWEGDVTPNDRIIWYYQRLLAFLTRRERLSITASMTHWEVARMLKLIGYPSNPIERITMLFERALYSGLNLSDMETVQMSASMTSLISVRKPEALDAV